MNAASFQDDDLTHFAAHGIPPLPASMSSGFVVNDHARIWYASIGVGAPVVLLHGGLGNADNWGHQVPALVDAGYRAIVIDSRGQGRSTRDARPYSYELMASDTRAVMDALGIAKAAFVGWSDGADIALVLSLETPARSAGVFFFACNVDGTGVKPFQASSLIDLVYDHHVREYARLSPLPGAFDAMRDDLGLMQASQPGYGIGDLQKVAVPVWSVLGEHDEFIERDHAEAIAQGVPRARFVLLPGVGHFAPLQRPQSFNGVMLAFLDEIHGRRTREEG
ncbi:MAG: alpha/beta fold hydrolase [Luteibacter jiangsuensis]